MKPITFKEHNVVIAKNQPEYIPLPAHVEVRTGIVTVCWSLTWSERLRLLITGCVWGQVMTFGNLRSYLWRIHYASILRNLEAVLWSVDLPF